jgi:hypothetical protein
VFPPLPATPGQSDNFGDGTSWLVRYADTPIVRHVKVRGDKSPYDGDWPYWVERLGRDPTRVQLVATTFQPK